VGFNLENVVDVVSLVEALMGGMSIVEVMADVTG
jgi:hypothetical protein